MNDLDLIPVDRLAAWLDEHGVGSGPIEDLELLTGGTQNILARFTRASGHGAEPVRRLVLRRPPRHPRPGASRTIEREVTVLTALAGSEVPHPRLRAACLDEEVLGAVCYVMHEVPGFTATATVPEAIVTDPALHAELGFAVVDALAAIGRVDPEKRGLLGLGRADGWLERQVDRWADQLATYAEIDEWPGPELPGLEAVTAWLRDHQPGSFVSGLIHGDYHFGNVMLDLVDGSPVVTAVVDWELATIGSPLLDLGHLLATWPDPDEPRTRGLAADLRGLPTKSEVIDRYAAGSARDLAPVDWYHVLACYRMGIILEGTHARACAGRVDRALGDRFHGVAQFMFEQAGRVIDASTAPSSTSSTSSTSGASS